MKKSVDDKNKQKQVVTDEQRKRLRVWNLRLGLLLVLEAVAILVLAGGQTVPLTMQYLTTDTLASDVAGHQVLAVATRHLWDVPLAWIVAKFLVIAALGYVLMATLWRQRYEAWLERGVNKLRWLVFGLSGGTMAVAIAMLSGVTDLSFLILILLAVLTAALSAMAVELLGPGRRLKRLLLAIACLAAVGPWIVFKESLYGVLAYNGTLPNFMYYVYASALLLFIALLLASYYRAKLRGKWADTVYTERMYLILGFLATSVLAWQIFAGALQP